MGIKFNPEKEWYEVSYSKRPGKNMAPIKLSRIGIKTEREAKLIERELILEVGKKITAKKVPNWRTVVLDYLEECRSRGLSKQTINGYETCLNAHTLEEWGRKFVDTITRDDVEKLHRSAVGDKSQGHQKYMLKCIRLAFGYAFDRGHINRNPVPVMKFKQRSKIMPVLNEEQARRLLTKAREFNDEWYPHWTVAIYTGMRNGELYALTWDNVDLGARLIYVKKAWDKMNGFKEYTKSGEDRVVSIPPELLLVLQELKLRSKGEYFVLPRLSKWDKGEQARELRRFLVGIGLPEIRFHDLRATWATLLLSKGVEAVKVMQMGGWSDYETMMIYIRKAGIDIRGSSDVLKLHNAVEKHAEVVQLSSGSHL